MRFWDHYFLNMLFRSLALLLLLAALLPGQRRVDPRYTYVRVITVESLHGAGTAADPKRPGYAPTALAAPGQATGGIIGYVHQVSDDGKYSITEYVARDISAFKTILSDKQITSFIKGQDKKSTIEAALKKYKKDFDLDKFGMVLP